MALNAALVSASHDAKVALLTPIWVPAVCDLPVFDAVLFTPSDDLHSVPAFHGSVSVGVDSASVVGKVFVDGECSFHRSSADECLLNFGFAFERANFTAEGVLVVAEFVVWGFCVRVAVSWASIGLLAWASWCALIRVWVVSLWSVVVAVRHVKSRAEASSKRSSSINLSSSDEASSLDVRPRSIDLSSVASVASHPIAEAHLFCGEWEHGFSIGGDAESVGSSFSSSKCPAAAAVGLVTDVANYFSAFWPVGGRIKRFWCSEVGVLEGSVVDLASKLRIDNGAQQLSVFGSGHLVQSSFVQVSSPLLLNSVHIVYSFDVVCRKGAEKIFFTRFAPVVSLADVLSFAVGNSGDFSAKKLIVEHLARSSAIHVLIRVTEVQN